MSLLVDLDSIHNYRSSDYSLNICFSHRVPYTCTDGQSYPTLVGPNILSFMVKALYFQSSGRTNNCQTEVLFKWSDQSCIRSPAAASSQYKPEKMYIFVRSLTCRTQEKKFEDVFLVKNSKQMNYLKCFRI